MTTNELKEACLERKRVIVRPKNEDGSNRAAWRGHHIEAVVHKPDYRTGKWKPCADVAFGDDGDYTIYHSIPAECIELDDNPYGDGFTMFRNYKEQLKAEQLRISGG